MHPYFSTISIEAALADAAGGDLRGEVAFAFVGRADVGEQQCQHVAFTLAATENFYWRNAQAFLKNFAGEAHGAGLRAADVGVMSAVGYVELRLVRCVRADRGDVSGR